MKPTLLLSLAAACAHAPPAETAPMSTLEPTSTVEPASTLESPARSPAPEPTTPSPPAPTPMTLAASPTHRVLEWYVDVITHRHGDVADDEILEYCGPGFLDPTSNFRENLKAQAEAADGAVLESLEVDDPFYVRGYLATSDRRWKIIMEINKTTKKMEYLRFTSAK